MYWNPHGLIFEPNKTISWMQSHAQMPVVDYLGEDLYRVYFASRDKNNYSHIGYFEFNIHQPSRILFYTKDPVLAPGDIGFFDEHGVFPSCIVTINRKKYLYYIGWNKGSETPLFYASIGLAISEDGGKTFYRYSKAPILSRSEHDPCFVSGPFVFDIQSGLFKMIYISGLKWERHPESGLWSYYHLKSAHSKDGIHWTREGKIAIDLQTESETNLARATILKKNGTYHAFFCSCGIKTPYQLGYAESTDGLHWERKENPVKNLDKETICYPYVFAHEKTYILFNGEKFGFKGIKMAELSQSQLQDLG